MSNKLIAIALFSISLSLLSVAWAIHDHTERHARYAIDNRMRVDTVTGEVKGCRWLTDHDVYCGDNE